MLLIPDGDCPQYAGMLALSPDTAKQMMSADIDREASCKRRIEDERAKWRSEREAHEATRAELGRAQWWADHGPVIAGVAAGAALLLGAVGGYVIATRPRYYRDARKLIRAPARRRSTSGSIRR